MRNTRNHFLKIINVSKENYQNQHFQSRIVDIYMLKGTVVNRTRSLIITAIKCKENRMYIRVEFSRKKCKTTILLYCFHTAGVLHIFALYNLLGPGISFYRKSNIDIKRNPNYEIG